VKELVTPGQYECLKTSVTYREAITKQDIAAETGPILQAKPFIWDRNKSDKNNYTVACD